MHVSDRWSWARQASFYRNPLLGLFPRTDYAYIVGSILSLVALYEVRKLEGLSRKGLPDACSSKSQAYANVPRDYANVEPEMEKRGLLQRGKIGDADVMAMKARELIDVCTRCIVEDPAFLLRDRTFLERCRDLQRGMIPALDQGTSDV
jgi:hypothetical protein